MRLELPTETEVQRKFRAFCGLTLEVAGGQDGEVIAQVAAPQFPHVPARTFWVHADADRLDGVVVMRALVVYVQEYLTRMTIFKEDRKEAAV